MVSSMGGQASRCFSPGSLAVFIGVASPQIFLLVPRGRLGLPCPCERDILSVVCLPLHHLGMFYETATRIASSFWRSGWELHPRIRVLQTPALLLGYQTIKKAGLQTPALSASWRTTRPNLIIHSIYYKFNLFTTLIGGLSR